MVRGSSETGVGEVIAVFRGYEAGHRFEERLEPPQDPHVRIDVDAAMEVHSHEAKKICELRARLRSPEKAVEGKFRKLGIVVPYLDRPARVGCLRLFMYRELIARGRIGHDKIDD